MANLSLNEKDGKGEENAKYGSVSVQTNGTVGKKTETVGKTTETVGKTTETVGKTTDRRDNKTTSSGVQLVKLATLAFGNFCVGACLSLNAPFFPAEAESKGVTSTEYGFIFGIYQLTIFLTAPIMGRLMAYISPKYLLNFGIITGGVTCILFGTLDLFNDKTTFVALAFTIRTVEGIGSAALKTSAYTIVAQQFPEGLGKAFAVLETFLGVGCIVGPTIGGALHDVGGYGLPFYVMGSLMLIDAVMIMLLFPKVETSKYQEKGNLFKLYLHPASITFSLTAFSCYNLIGFLTATLEPHLREFHLSGYMLGFMFSLAGIFFSFSAPGFGWLIDKKFFSSEYLCLSGCACVLLAVVLLGPAPFLPLKLNIYFIVVAQSLAGVAYGSKLVGAFTGMLTSASNRGFPAETSTYGLVSSIIASSQSLGACVGPSVGGYLLNKYGFENASMYQLFQELVLIALLLFLVTRRKLCGITAKLPLSEKTKIPTKTKFVIAKEDLKIENVEKDSR